MLKLYRKKLAESIIQGSSRCIMQQSLFISGVIVGKSAMVKVISDNAAVIQILNTFRTSEEFLDLHTQNIWLSAAENNFQFYVEQNKGCQNKKAGVLSQ